LQACTHPVQRKRAMRGVPGIDVDDARVQQLRQQLRRDLDHGLVRVAARGADAAGCHQERQQRQVHVVQRLLHQLGADVPRLRTYNTPSIISVVVAPNIY